MYNYEEITFYGNSKTIILYIMLLILVNATMTTKLYKCYFSKYNDNK